MARVTNRKALIPILTEALHAHTTTEWLAKMRGAGFPFAPVNNIEQTFAHPQAVARGVVSEVNHPRAGKIKLLSPAVSYNNQKMKVSNGCLCLHSIVLFTHAQSPRR
jgi:succinate---hydroxymethylglutarate CoA-transferase